MSKKIVVFGATGHIGAYLIDHLLNNLSDEYEIIAVARRNLHFYENMRVKTVKVDITSETDFCNLPSTDVYAVVNLTSVLPAYSKVIDPISCAETNIMGSLRIMEYARRVSADRVIYTQTWSEYAGYWGKERVLSPSMDRKLIFKGDHAFYSITKSTVVDTMEFYKQEYGIKSFIFVLPNVYMYAPITTYYDNGVEKIIAYRYMIERASRGEDIELWGNPDAFKDILYIKDLCSMIQLAIITETSGGKYNAGTGVATTLRQQIQGIIDVFSPSPDKTRIIEKPDKPSFVSFVMDIENVKNELGYNPEYDLIGFLKDYKKERDNKRFDSLFGQR